MAAFTIEDLKKHLGPGLGLRKNKYLIEIPVPGTFGKTLNILCRSAGLPERNINTVNAFHKGRKYNMRGETSFNDTYEISIVDDSKMNLRKVFDKWLIKVDNTKPRNLGILGASFEADFLSEITQVVETVNNVQTQLEFDGGASFFLGFLDEGNANSAAKYQADINIWQLSATGDKVYGYKLQNAFPSALGIVTLDDGDENTLSEFSVTFTFSEFISLENKSIQSQIGRALIGDDVANIAEGIESIFS